jgi:hypothetical protein
MTSDDTPATPEPGTDSKVEDWFGQSVERDAELADELESLPPEEAERRFEQESEGRAEQEARRGDRIDPEQGESAYKSQRESDQ